MDYLMRLLVNAEKPLDEESVKMDCNDGCEEIAQLAERVAKGERVEDVLPNYAEHLKQWDCCREEFEVLVEVIRAEQAESES